MPFDPLNDPALSSFLDDLDVVVTRPAPAPRPGLAAFFDGVSTDVSLADSSPVPAPRATRRRKMIVSQLLGGLITKLAGLGMASKAALGLGVAVASVTTAGAANVLPDAAQNAVAKAFNAVAPFEMETADVADVPTGEEVIDGLPIDTQNPDGGGVDPLVTDGEGDDEGEGDDDVTEGRPQNHGACVSAVARDRSTQGAPGAHGKAVSEVARSDCGKQAREEPTTTTTTIEETDTDTGTGTGTGTDDQVGASSNPGRGNGNNAGQGGGPANAGQGNRNAGSNGNAGGNAGRR
jgi:hypothetical protein